ncbi:MAG TPA: zf-HC2 domain-containing protein [Longimicrobium sp.]|nr:zf-HC2 domain-containing protein [Longimicrobium sp.]
MRASAHPPLDALRAFGDGEAPAAEARRTAAHLEGCSECRARLAALRALRDEIRQATTLAPPPHTWERITARRAAGEELILPTSDAADGPDANAAATRFRRLPVRRTALLLLGVAGVASATVPGSPLREALRGLVSPRNPAAPPPASPVTTPGPEAPAPPPVPPAAAAPPPEKVPEAGIGVAPAAGEVRVVVTAPGAALRIRVSVGDVPVAQVRGRDAAAQAGFASGRGRITVTGARAGELVVVLPRAARRATLTVDGTLYVVVEGGQMTVLVQADSSGAELVFPGRP